MIKLICIFFPALLAVWLYEHLVKTDLKGKSWAYRYSLNVLLINGICFALKQYILQTGEFPLADGSGDMLPSVALNYCIICIPLAVVLAVVQVFLNKHTCLTVEEAKDDE